jgi:hypothetical protein
MWASKLYGAKLIIKVVLLHPSQMHGIVWWSAKDVVQETEKLISSRAYCKVWSDLITWQDSRCDQRFLEKYRNRIPKHVSPIASGIKSYVE